MLSFSAKEAEQQNLLNTTTTSSLDSKRRNKKLAKRARHRLWSIHYDVEHFVRPTLQHSSLEKLPVFANERCGSWYAHPFLIVHHQQNDDSDASSSSCQYPYCYFKSTDGHPGTWNFSLKRLHLRTIVRAATTRRGGGSGGCVILDASASKTKELPDSLARTIPIWAAVLNRIVARYRRDLGMDQPQDGDEWDVALHTPDFVVSEEEHEQMSRRLEDHVESLYASQAIVDPQWLVATLVKPLRPYWITPQRQSQHSWEAATASYFPVICISCSDYRRATKGLPQGNRGGDASDASFIYTSGAADDHESWARHLTPRLFWENADRILWGAAGGDDDDEDGATITAEDETDRVIDAIVQRALEMHEGALEGLVGGERGEENGSKLFDVIHGNTKIAIGTRRAGRPPECWQNFEAVLNVTDMEYSEMVADRDSSASGGGSQPQQPRQPESGYYLQLPVKEGKRDRSELERWLAVGAIFVLWHARQERRILIHCAQGKDRSVAVAMCVVALFCDLKYPLQWKNGVDNLSIDDLMPNSNNTDDNANSTATTGFYYQRSGLPQQLVDRLLGRNGRDLLMEWVRRGLHPAATTLDGGSSSSSSSEMPSLPAATAAAPPPPPLATKETLRVALLLIQQDREKADPSRSTMQKLNRFFMSKDRVQ